MFLNRFTLTFGHSLMDLTTVPVASILLYQYISGRLVIQYDRLLWFLAVALCAAWSLLSHFSSTKLPSFFLFVVLYSLLTFVRPTTSEQYRTVLRAYQSLIVILSFLAIGQFVAQFVLDGRKLVQFYGILPEYLFTDSFNTIIPITSGSSLIKSNAIFLAEPSSLSQLTALAILIEILEFSRPKYLLLFAVALLLSYSGTGLMVLFVFGSLAGFRYRAARVPILLIVGVAIVLVGTGAIDMGAFTSRVGEFENTRASGFERFVSPFWLAQRYFDTGELPNLLFGNGPGTTAAFVSDAWYTASAGTWLKLIYEYGLIGAFLFACFLASCVRRSKCPGLLLAAILFIYLIPGDALLDPGTVTIIAVLCTLSGPIQPRYHPADRERADGFGASAVAGSGAG